MVEASGDGVEDVVGRRAAAADEDEFGVVRCRESRWYRSRGGWSSSSMTFTACHPSSLMFSITRRSNSSTQMCRGFVVIPALPSCVQSVDLAARSRHREHQSAGLEIGRGAKVAEVRRFGGLRLSVSEHTDPSAAKRSFVA